VAGSGDGVATTPAVVGFGVGVMLVAFGDGVGVIETDVGLVEELGAVGSGTSCAAFPHPLKTAMSKKTNNITR
jgi:hypothetical protein